MVSIHLPAATPGIGPMDRQFPRWPRSMLCYYEARAPQSTEQARPVGCFNPREASEDFTEEGVYRIRYLTQGIPNVLRHSGGFMRLGDDEVEGERKNEESG